MMFISFEGIDGCGKTTQLHKLGELLEVQGQSVITTREPGGTALAEQVREMLLHSEVPLSKATELLLFGAARAQHWSEKIRPALEQGTWVLCDRFIDSSEAYQGGGLGLSDTFIRQMNAFACEENAPHLTFLLDVPLEESLRRREARGKDRIEARGIAFLTQVREAYLAVAERDSARIVIIDATQSVEAIHAQIVSIIEARSAEKAATEKNAAQ